MGAFVPFLHRDICEVEAMSRHSDELRSRARRAAAISRPELRNAPPFISVDERLPDPRLAVTGFAIDGAGGFSDTPYKLPFPVFRIDEKWFNAARGNPLDVKIVGWRPV